LKIPFSNSKIKKEILSIKRFSELSSEEKKTFRLLHLAKDKEMVKNGRTKLSISQSMEQTIILKIKSIKKRNGNVIGEKKIC
jgi:hypothetical protein